jgi:flagellar motility protein MotE (MotC chaperone)
MMKRWARPPHATAAIASVIIAASVASLAFGVAVANASGEAAHPEEASTPAPVAAQVPAGATVDEIQQYCASVVDPARDRRYLLQKQDLEKLQAGVDERLKVLDKHKAEYEDWLQRRNDFMNKAEANLVEIYKSMKPNVAAERLAVVDVNISAAILMKLSAKQTGLIMGQMDAATAGKLTALIASAADANTSKENP